MSIRGDEESVVRFSFISSYHEKEHSDYDELHAWNYNDEFFHGVFDDHHIGYATNRVLKMGWTFEELLSVSRVWADVKVWHQCSMDLVDEMQLKQ